jgi:hypothetical protein
MDGTGDTDTVDFGRAPSPRVWQPRLVGVAVVALVLGYLAGGGAASPSEPSSPAAAAPSPTVVAGVLDQAAAAEHGAEFALPLRNAGTQDVRVTLLSVGSLRLAAERAPTVELSPGETQSVWFKVPDDCSLSSRRGSLDSAGITTEIAGSRRTLEIRIPDVTALAEYRTAVCAAQDDIDVRELLGVWLVERSFGGWDYGEGAHLVRFRADGTFVADPDGRLFTADVAVAGRYWLRDGLLRTETDSGAACAPGTHATWRVHRRGPVELALVFADGACPRAPAGVWLIRRVLVERGLPPPAVTLDRPGA